MRSLAAQALVLAASTALSQILYGILIAVSASRAAPAEFGVAVAAIALGGFLGGLLDFGFTAYSVRELSSGRMSQADFWNRLRAKLAVGIVGALPIMAIATVLSLPKLGVMVVLIMVSRTFLMSVSAPPRAAYRIVRVAVVVLIERAAALATFAAASMVLSLGALDALWLSMAIGATFASIAGVALAGSGSDLWRSRKLSRPWAGVAGYGNFSLAVSACTLDVAVLGLAGGAAQAGLYGAVSRWTQPIQLLGQSYSSAATPFIAGARSSRAAFQAVRNSMWILVLGAGACVLMVVMASSAISAVLGDRYRGAVPVLSLLAVGAGMVLTNQPLATFLQARGYDQFVGKCTISTVLVQLVGVWLAANTLGAVGAALSYALSQLALLLMLAYGARNLVGRHEVASLRAASEPAEQEGRDSNLSGVTER